jgi:hypothetical protein
LEDRRHTVQNAGYVSDRERGDIEIHGAGDGPIYRGQPEPGLKAIIHPCSVGERGLEHIADRFLGRSAPSTTLKRSRKPQRFAAFVVILFSFANPAAQAIKQPTPPVSVLDESIGIPPRRDCPLLKLLLGLAGQNGFRSGDRPGKIQWVCHLAARLASGRKIGPPHGPLQLACEFGGKA